MATVAATAAALFSAKHMAVTPAERDALKSFIVEAGVDDLLDPAAAVRWRNADPSANISQPRLLRLLQRLQVGLTAHLDRFTPSLGEGEDAGEGEGKEEDEEDDGDAEEAAIPEHPRSRDRRQLEEGQPFFQAFQELMSLQLKGAMRGATIPDRVQRCSAELSRCLCALKAGEELRFMGGAATVRLGPDGLHWGPVGAEPSILMCHSADVAGVAVGQGTSFAVRLASSEEPLELEAQSEAQLRTWVTGLAALRSALLSQAKVSQAEQLVWQALRVRLTELSSPEELGSVRGALEALEAHLQDLKGRGLTEFESWLVCT